MPQQLRTLFATDLKFLISLCKEEAFLIDREAPQRPEVAGHDPKVPILLDVLLIFKSSAQH